MNAHDLAPASAPQAPPTPVSEPSYIAPRLERLGQWQALTLARSFPVGIGSLNFTDTSQDDWGL